jgi:EpsI family protein
MTKDQGSQIWKGFNLWKVGLLCLLLLGGAGFVHSFDSEMETAIVIPLDSFPYEIGRWEARDDIELSVSAAEMLGVDDYSYRNYQSPEGRVINFYASYFSAIRQGKGYHSPLNCMPGSGWGIASTESITLELANGKEVKVRKMLLNRGAEYHYSLYWYQGRSRIVASEYWDMIYRLMDSIRYGRTDGAFIRLIVLGSQDQGKAFEELKEFARDIIPILEEHFPGV